MEADLLDVLSEYLEYVAAAYGQHEEHMPVMLFDIQEKRIYAYPCDEFKKELSETSQAKLTEQYEQAQRTGQMVVFVRDNENRRLVSYSLDPHGY